MNHDKIIERCIESIMPYAERRMAVFFQYRDFTDDLSYQAYTEKTTLHINVKDKSIPSTMVFQHSIVNSDCIVCYDECYTKLRCCHQYLCKGCLNKLQHLSCPMCRVTIEQFETHYRIPLKIMKMLGFKSK
jgi:hypothetical protein